MIGRYAELLRVIGQWLDANEAQSIELLATAHTITVRWRPPRGRPLAYTFDGDELAEMGQKARAQLTDQAGQMAGQWATLLRTLGHELDHTGRELLVARSVAEGIQVLGTDPTTPATQWFAPERLGHWNAVQRASRVA